MTNLPDKSGNYYWRESDVDEWQIIKVELAMLNDEPEVNGMCCESPLSGEYVHVSEIDGQWLPIPTAEELVELQAKAKMVDDGQKLWVSFDVETGEPYAIDRDPAITIHDTWKLLGRHPQGNMPGGFVNRKVRVCKEA
jgi:hypothetical protein